MQPACVSDFAKERRSALCSLGQNIANLAEVIRKTGTNHDLSEVEMAACAQTISVAFSRASNSELLEIWESLTAFANSRREWDRFPK